MSSESTYLHEDKNWMNAYRVIAPRATRNIGYAYRTRRASERILYAVAVAF